VEIIRSAARIAFVLSVFLSNNVSAADNVYSSASDGWDFELPATQLSARCDTALAQARAAFKDIENNTEPATLQSVFGAYDAMLIDLQPIQHVEYMKAVHPDSRIQTAAEECFAQYTDFVVATSLSPAFFQRVAAIDLSNASEPERFMVNRKLALFRRAGVDRDKATRDKVRALITEITRLGSRFEKTIRLDKRYIETTPDQLEGLPQDFLDAHPADRQGVVIISTDYPDYLPVLNYASDDDLRYRLFKAAKNIATPANSATLKTLITRRHELAVLLGYESHAAMAMDGLMAADPQTVQRFLAQLGAAVQKPADRELAELLTRLREVDPQAEQVQA
jgi:thimet oligopeptidase